MFKRMTALVFVLLLVLPVFTSDAASIIKWTDWLEDQEYINPDYDMSNVNMRSDNIMWGFTPLGLLLRNEAVQNGKYYGAIPMEGITRYFDNAVFRDVYDASVTNIAMTDSRTLCFDYTATIDLAPDEDGNSTYHYFFVIFYMTVDDAAAEYAKGKPTLIGSADGFQVVRYGAPGVPCTEDGVKSEENVTLVLPDNFDPSIHLIGYAVMRFDNEPIDERDGFIYNEFSASKVKLLDLSYYIENPPPDPEPEPEPEILLGDVNGDGTVNLTDAALLMKYIAKWDVEIDLEAANMNGDSGINSVDVSRIMKRVAGWDESWWKG